MNIKYQNRETGEIVTVLQTLVWMPEIQRHLTIYQKEDGFIRAERSVEFREKKFCAIGLPFQIPDEEPDDGPEIQSVVAMPKERNRKSKLQRGLEVGMK